MPRDIIDLPTRTIQGYVTPYALPPIARSDVAAWRASGKPSFIKAFERREDACTNCQGTEFIIIDLIESGPYKSPPSHGVITWLDGTDNQREGWYKIDKTMTYPCPKCGEKR